MIPDIDERILNEQNPLKLTIRELRLRCQSTAPAPERETFTGRRARFFSIYLTRYWLLTPVTPNQITVVSVLVFLTGVGLFLTQRQSLAILGSVLVFFATVLDGNDGEVARFRTLKSPVGAIYAEPVSHDVQYGLMFIPLGWAAMTQTGQPMYLLLGFFASVTKLLTRLVETRFWMLKQGGVPATAEETVRARQALQSRSSFRKMISWAKRNILSSNGMILPLLLAAIAGKLPWYVAFYGVMYPVLWLMIFGRQIPKLSAAAESKMPAVPGSAD